MSNPLSRRRVIAIGGGVTLLPLASLVELAGIRPTRASEEAWKLTTLDQREAVLLLCVSRTLFPHDFLDDRQYMKIVAVVDSKASADKDVAATVKTALKGFPDDFAASGEAHREDYLRTLEATPFFRLVYQETLTGLYGDPTVSALLGDEGSSVEHGGYIQRGFDDISWLPPEKTGS